MLLHKLQIINGDMYNVIKRIKIDHGPIIETWKEHLGCDKIFMNKNEGYYYFCILIPELEIVEGKAT